MVALSPVIRAGVTLAARTEGVAAVTEFGNKLKTVDTQAKNTGVRLGGLSKVGRTFAATAKAVAGPLALGAVAVGFSKAFTAAVDYGDALDKASQRTNVSAQTLDRWYRSATLSDVSNKRINKSLFTLSARLKNATDNTDSLIINNKSLTVNSSAVSKAFKDLGINVIDSTGNLKTNEQVMREIGDSIQRLGS